MDGGRPQDFIEVDIFAILPSDQPMEPPTPPSSPSPPPTMSPYLTNQLIPQPYFSPRFTSIQSSHLRTTSPARNQSSSGFFSKKLDFAKISHNIVSKDSYLLTSSPSSSSSSSSPRRYRVRSVCRPSRHQLFTARPTLQLSDSNCLQIYFPNNFRTKIFWL